MLRNLSLAAILAGAVGVPYAVFNADKATEFAGGLFGDSHGEDPDSQGSAAAASDSRQNYSPTSYTSAEKPVYDPTAYGPSDFRRAAAPANAAPANAAPANAAPANAEQPNGDSAESMPAQISGAGSTMAALAEVLRMDITPRWVTQRSPRVTTTLADTSYSGLRVPFVSGTRETDVTGSLTYYFDRQEKLQRITFHGTTGDPRELTALLTQHLEFEKRTALNGELYTRRWLSRTTSVCRIRPADVIHAGATNTRYEILLELNRGQWKNNLSEAAARLVE